MFVYIQYVNSNQFMQDYSTNKIIKGLNVLIETS